MRLAPCAGCRRHVEVGATDCPFCRAIPHRELAPSRPTRIAGRLGRAAVFAGAALAGCHTSTPASPQPPPPDRQQQQVVAPPPTTDAGTFAQPPPDAAVAKQLVPGHIHGRVAHEDGRVIAYQVIQLFADGQTPRSVRTNPKGEFVFDALPPGTYSLVFQLPRNHPRRSPPEPVHHIINLAEGAKERIDVVVPMAEQVIDHGPCCKPYGAPPARRRVV